MSQQAKVVRFERVDIPRRKENNYHKPNNDNAACSTWSVPIREHVERIDQTRLYIWDDRMTDEERQRRGIPRRPGHIIGACDTLKRVCENIRQVDGYLLHSPYKPLVDDGIRLLASKILQVLAETVWIGVHPEFVDMMHKSAIKISSTAAERREWWRIETARIEAERKRQEGGQ